MTTPWHLAYLGLGIDADGRDVRRAYAAKLKNVDPAQDLEGFAMLRAAYDAARAWCDGERAPPPPEPVVDTPIPRATPTDIPAPAHPLPSEATIHALADSAFADLLASFEEVTGDDVPLVMERIVTDIRRHGLAATEQFESRLIMALHNGELTHGFDVFDAANDLFEWEDVASRPVDAATAHWLRRAFTHAELWYRTPWADRRRWMDRVTAARRFPDRLPRHLGWRWPEVYADALPYADFTRIVLAPELAHRWSTQYATSHALMRRISQWVAWGGFLAFFVGVMWLALHHHHREEPSLFKQKMDAQSAETTARP